MSYSAVRRNAGEGTRSNKKKEKKAQERKEKKERQMYEKKTHGSCDDVAIEKRIIRIHYTYDDGTIILSVYGRNARGMMNFDSLKSTTLNEFS